MNASNNSEALWEWIHLSVVWIILILTTFISCVPMRAQHASSYTALPATAALPPSKQSFHIYSLPYVGYADSTGLKVSDGR